MPVGQEQQELEADDSTIQQQDEADAQNADGEDADAAAGETEAETESAKKEVHPALTVTSPGSGAQYPSDQPIAVEFDCEGDVELTAHVSVVDASGNQVLEDASDLKLEDGKGHGAFSLGGDRMIAGKYDVLVWGESDGQATSVQKVQVEVVETVAEQEPTPAVAVEGDDGDGDGEDLSA
ncbi:MAG: hypothetical protein LC659_11990 [Myxococcales bacterium]|nr:hypothetical protein [Myxococcales bacterium]